MADFAKAFEKTWRAEGGYRLENVAGDRGRQTYAGISRRYHPGWPGWAVIDRGDLSDPTLPGLVLDFYRAEFWEKIQGDRIVSQRIAETIFDFAVNVDPRDATRLAQIACGAAPDGDLGPKTLACLNAVDAGYFMLAFFAAKIDHYAANCNSDRSQEKFLLGWVNRAIKQREG